MQTAASRRVEIILSLPDQSMPPGVGEPIAVDPGGVIPGKKLGVRLAVVTSGVVRLNARTASARGALIGYRSRGWIVGDLQPWSPELSPLVATAVTPCTIRTVGRTAFSLFDAAQREALLLYLTRMYALETRAHVQRETEFLARTPLERVALFLHEFADQCGALTGRSQVHVDFPLTQVELAQYLRLSPEHTNRMIHRLRQEAVIVAAKWPALTLDLVALTTLRHRLRTVAE